MTTTIKKLALAASLAALTVPLTAQDTGTKSTAHAKSPFQKPALQQSGKPQPRPAAHGVKSKKLTAGEAASLERKEAGLSAEERQMREDNRGRLTSANRARHQQKHVAKATDHKKHNASVTSAHPKSAPGPRPQPHRTAQLKTGQLTTRHAAHLETKEASLHHQIHSDREQDGKLSEGAESQTQPNKTTHEIHLKKHNARMF